jgi:DNA repair exonuclease SbcCD ATPase subunit
MHGRADADVQKLEGRVAQLEVDLRDANERRDKAESARAVAEEAMAKSEVARHKAAEQAIKAAQAHDQVATGTDDARRENERLKRRIAELETKSAAAGPDPAALQAELESLGRKLKEATDKATSFERGQKSLQAEVDAARADAKHARAEADAAKLAGGSAATDDTVDGPAGGDELRRLAGEVYDAINDILSELRNNVVLIQGEVANLKESGGDAARIIADTVDSLVGNAEDAKGALRGLRELAGN